MTPITLFKANSLNEEFSFPTSWDEFDLEELVMIAETYFKNKYTAAELFIHLLRHRMTLKFGKKKASNLLLLIDTEDLAMNYMELLAFIKDNIALTTQPLKITPAPGNEFDDILVGTFEDADLFLTQYLQGEADKLIEFYKMFYQTTTENTQPYMLVAALFFIGCKNTLPSIFPLVFPIPDIDLEGKPIKQESDVMALTKLIHELAGPKNGTRKDIRATLLKEFLYECQLEAEKAPDVY